MLHENVQRTHLSGEESIKNHVDPLISDVQKESLIKLAREVYKGNIACSILFEALLDKEGLLVELERAGILPIVKSPNPYNFEVELERSEQWWEKHPEEEKKFAGDFEKREKRLRLLYVGVLLGTLINTDLTKP